jgi:ribonuclease HI
VKKPYGSNQLNKNIKDLEKEAISYFTDGSKMCNQEFVYFSYMTAPGEIRHQYQTTEFVSIFTGEAMVVLKTLEIISESQGESVYVCSDSRNVLTCLNERSLTKKKHSILILKIKEKLLALKKHKMDFTFVWIPAHMGIVNETADELAKESIRKGEDAQYFIPDTDLKSYWKTKVGGMVHRIQKTERQEVLRVVLPKQWKTLVSEIQISNKIYRLNK